MSEKNEHAKRLLLVADLLERRGDSIGALGCEKAAAEIERLEALHRPWLPIELAPLDGTRVELWCERTENFEKQKILGFAAYGHHEVVEGDGIWLCDRGYPLCPTHYRREPTAPPPSPSLSQP